MVRSSTRTLGHGLLGLAVVGLALTLLAPSGAFGATEELTINYSFDRPQVSQVKIAGKLYDRVTMLGAANGGKVGQPALPACGAHVLLPSGAEVSSIEIVAAEKVLLGSGYLIEPVPAQGRLSDGPDAAVPPTPDPAIYASDSPFPQAQFEEIGTQSFRGYRILILRLQPVQYVPTSGELHYYPQLTVIVNTADTGTPPSLFRGLPQDRQEVVTKVDNPEVVATYGAAGERDGRAFDLLIITTTSLSSAFQPLKDFHDTYGLATEIHTTADIGSSDPVEVRDYIRERYENDGIEYVIIGADDDIIPAKDLYVDGTNDMPGDIYFSCLDGDGTITPAVVDATMEILQVDQLGLDSLDRAYLTSLIKHYDGGPADIEAIAATMAHERDTLEDVVEPYLLQLGFVIRTPPRPRSKTGGV